MQRKCPEIEGWTSLNKHREMEGKMINVDQQQQQYTATYNNINAFEKEPARFKTQGQ